MSKRKQTPSQVPDESVELKNRLEETEETLQAIRQYLVDAFVVNREDGAQVVTIGDAGFPYRMMVEAMNEGAVTLIEDGTIFYCNPRFAEMVQMESEQLIGIRLHDLIPAEQRDDFASILDQASHNGMRGEFALQPANGKRVPVQLSVYRLGTEGPGGISIIATDISERVRNEEKIHALASELAVAEREERRRISQVLHDDLQQRLFAIKSQLSLLVSMGSTDTPAQMQELLSQVQTWISDAITITRNLSIDMGPSALRNEGLLETLRELAWSMNELHGLQVELQAEDDLSNLNEHVSGLLFDSVRELLFNVVKHSGVNHATVKLERSEKKGRITIRDSGKGFDANLILQESSVAHGLLLIQDRLRMVGGQLEVHSIPGKGTHIVVEFPIEEDAA
jgi:PAS domain S-box-containing protein